MINEPLPAINEEALKEVIQSNCCTIDKILLNQKQCRFIDVYHVLYVFLQWYYNVTSLSLRLSTTTLTDITKYYQEISDAYKLMQV